jgi:hypothetical protein
MRQGLAAYGRAFLNHPPTALKSWKRIGYAFLSLLGLKRVREIYVKKRKKDLAQKGN